MVNFTAPIEPIAAAARGMAKIQVLEYCPHAVAIRPTRTTPSDPLWAIYAADPTGSPAALRLATGNNSKQAWQAALTWCRNNNLQRQDYDRRSIERASLKRTQEASRQRKIERHRDEGAGVFARELLLIVETQGRRETTLATIIERCTAMLDKSGLGLY